jgi:hypothetical protein
MLGCALVIIDPIGSFIGARVDAHRDNAVRGVLAPLAALARRTGAAVLLVAHQRKGNALHADDLVLGSRAFTGIARSVLHLMRDPDDDDRRLVLPGKINLSHPAPGLAFSIAGDPPAVRWEDDPVTLTADSILAAHAERGSGRRTERDDAEDWLRCFLSDGARTAREVEHEAREAGVSIGTLRRAKASIGVVSLKSSFGGQWEWMLPIHEAATEGAHLRKARFQRAHSSTSAQLRFKNIENNDDRPKVRTVTGLRTFVDRDDDIQAVSWGSDACETSK